MNILVFNAGSSSLKYRVFDMIKRQAISGGQIERIGHPRSVFKDHRGNPMNDNMYGIDKSLTIPDHLTALQIAIKNISSEINQLHAVGHRVVMGGEKLTQTCLVDESVIETIEKYCALAPLHNPHNLKTIRACLKLFSHLPHIAVFDTQFHQTIPEHAFLYGIPYKYYKKYHIRRYGFHGTSHKYVSQQAAVHMGLNIRDLNLITLHLGNGVSICAIKSGKSIDTSMGMTPLAGIMMGTRPGNLDPGMILYLKEQTGMDDSELERIFNQESGLKGICGMSDQRDIHQQIKQSDDKAKLALEMFVYQVIKSIGAYAAVLGRLDGLVFTAGIGENDPVVRSRICCNLETLGIGLDPERNNNNLNQAFPIHSEQSRIPVWVIPTQEEFQIAIEAEHFLK